MYANFAPDDARQSDVIHTLFFNVARQQCGHLQIYKHIYKYIFRSNSRGLAPLGLSQPDKFINLATLGSSALASRGTNITFSELNFPCREQLDGIADLFEQCRPFGMCAMLGGF